MAAWRCFLTALCRLFLRAVEEGLGPATSNDATEIIGYNN